MRRVHLVHWNAAEAEERAERLAALGYDVEHAPVNGPEDLLALRERPPAAFVIDLSRIPSRGRDVGLVLRKYKDTRRVPIVFVDGDPQKRVRAKELLPDAVFTSWRGIREALRRAIAHPPQAPAVPRSTLAGYAGAPLAKKLGIERDAVVALIDAPEGFEQTLADLPAGVRLRRGARGRFDLALWFPRSLLELERRVERLAAQPAAAHGRLWIAWPKKRSGLPSELSSRIVREIAATAGLVDFKVCSIDATWSAHRFTRKNARGR